MINLLFSQIIMESVRRLSKDGSTHVTDEVFNTCSSGIGAVLAVIGVTLLLYQAWAMHKPWHFLGFAVYGFGLISLFTLSALHHGINGSPKTEHTLRQLDYFAIFLMIAGSATPFCTILLRDTLSGRVVLVVLWTLSIIGILIKGFFPNIPKWFTTGLYLGMGWVGVTVFYPAYQMINWKADLLLAIGGLAYTGGAVLYYLEKPNPFPGKFGFHEIWHLCVLTGAATHFCVMYFFLLPY
ncbi:MAG: hemolysin III family protein [Deltaproteobacteria bacterium]|nr:hemolysin III family protein [Deltaproteobacteria bacterium]